MSVIHGIMRRQLNRLQRASKSLALKCRLLLIIGGVIIAGHTRYKAAELLGLEKVPCIVANDLTPEQIKAFRLADNKVAEFAEWDFALLADELEELTAFDVDFSMVDFGFEDDAEKRDFGHIEELLQNGLAGASATIEKEVFGVTFNFPVEEKTAVMDYIGKMGKEYFVNQIIEGAKANVG